MADELKLGSTNLPLPCWPAGSPPDIPEERENNIQAVDMLDGSKRYNVPQYEPRVWRLEWDGIEASDLSTLQTVYAVRGEQTFVNSYMGITSATVVITEFGWSLKAETYARTARYRAWMTLKEVLG